MTTGAYPPNKTFADASAPVTFMGSRRIPPSFNVPSFLYGAAGFIPDPIMRLAAGVHISHDGPMPTIGPNHTMPPAPRAGAIHWPYSHPYTVHGDPLDTGM